MIKKVILFLVINFAALAVGGSFTGEGVPSEWYQTLNKAPWTPPGWVFGTVWTVIMVCFSFYMAIALDLLQNPKQLIALYVIQLILNIAWNPIFFALHKVFFGLITISLLTILITFFLFGYKEQLKYRSLLVLPYFLWLLIATSLNAYVIFMN